MLLTLISCAPKNVVKRNKYYIACCDPSLSENDKDKCKWLDKMNIDTLRDSIGDIYEGVWSDCRRGEEPWRKWE